VFVFAAKEILYNRTALLSLGCGKIADNATNSLPQSAILVRFQAGHRGILALVIYGSAMIVIFSSPLNKYPTTNIGWTDGNTTITLN
jgi:hypothetical protein